MPFYYDERQTLPCDVNNVLATHDVQYNGSKFCSIIHDLGEKNRDRDF